MADNNQSDDASTSDDDVLVTDFSKLPAALVSGFEDVERLVGRETLLIILKDRISRRSRHAGMEYVCDGGQATIRIAFENVAGLNAVLRKPIVVKLPVLDDPESTRKVALTAVPEVYSKYELVLSPAVLAEFPSRDALSTMCAKLPVALSEDGGRIISSSVCSLDRFRQHVVGKMMEKRSAGRQSH